MKMENGFKNEKSKKWKMSWAARGSQPQEPPRPAQASISIALGLISDDFFFTAMCVQEVPIQPTSGTQKSLRRRKLQVLP